MRDGNNICGCRPRLDGVGGRASRSGVCLLGVVLFHGQPARTSRGPPSRPTTTRQSAAEAPTLTCDTPFFLDEEALRGLIFIRCPEVQCLQQMFVSRFD